MQGNGCEIGIHLWLLVNATLRSLVHEKGQGFSYSYLNRSSGRRRSNKALWVGREPKCWSLCAYRNGRLQTIDNEIHLYDFVQRNDSNPLRRISPRREVQKLEVTHIRFIIFSSLQSQFTYRTIKAKAFSFLKSRNDCKASDKAQKQSASAGQLLTGFQAR